MSGDDGERYFYGVFVDVTDEKLAQKRAGELYEKELAYFVQAASAEGSIQGRVNITQDRVESYHSTEAAAITQKGETYEKAIGKLAAAASEPEYGKYLRTALDRANVVAEFAAGKNNYDFEYLRKRKDGGIFWSRTNFRFYQNPESGDLIEFFYTSDVTEQKYRDSF